MAYIGNDLEVAFQSYLIIDDISGDFDGSETSFTLNVNGAVLRGYCKPGQFHHQKTELHPNR